MIQKSYKSQEQVQEWNQAAAENRKNRRKSLKTCRQNRGRTAKTDVGQPQKTGTTEGNDMQPKKSDNCKNRFRTAAKDRNSSRKILKTCSRKRQGQLQETILESCKRQGQLQEII
jgi:hypothetical protein